MLHIVFLGSGLGCLFIGTNESGLANHLLFCGLLFGQVMVMDKMVVVDMDCSTVVVVHRSHMVVVIVHIEMHLGYMVVLVDMAVTSFVEMFVASLVDMVEVETPRMGCIYIVLPPFDAEKGLRHRRNHLIVDLCLQNNMMGLSIERGQIVSPNFHFRHFPRHYCYK